MRFYKRNILNATPSSSDFTKETFQMQHLHPQGDFKIEYISKCGIQANGYKLKHYGTHWAAVKQKAVTTTMNTN